jgi:anthranilate synthase component 1
MFVHTQISAFNADCYTPVELYLKLRHSYRKCCLLESNDYHSRQDSHSLIGFDPLVEITLKNGELCIVREGKTHISTPDGTQLLSRQIQALLDDFEFQEARFNGFIGRVGFEFNQQEETRVKAQAEKDEIPQLHLLLFRFVLVLDHFTHVGTLLENSLSGTFSGQTLDQLLRGRRILNLPFALQGKEHARFSDEAFESKVRDAIGHCARGEVFQLVLSNRFRQAFFGDDFQVYRQLRQLNPSPYLFYFDFEDYRLFGSSPEAQIKIQKGQAEIHPIAGTVPRTGISEMDALQLEHLLADEKENAEHTMLVDLARNDLSRMCEAVKVRSYKEIQHFSHVIHLVSKVEGKLSNTRHFEALCQSFPAGTLSGTPKPRALELIAEMEGGRRNFYGGAIGLIGAGRTLNTAIVIRSVLSRNQQLFYAAGAGVLVDSDARKETEEVHHKLKAVRTALNRAHAVHQPLIPQAL